MIAREGFPRRRPLCGLLVMALCALMLSAVGCGKSSSDSDKSASKEAGSSAQKPPAKEGGAEKAEEGKGEEKPGTVTLKPEQVQAIGLTTATLSTAEHRQETEGYAVVASHDLIAQAVAELRTAQAAARQSRSALERARSLVGSPGAVSADVLEQAVRQGSVDNATVALAERKLALIVGTNPPWPPAEREAMLEKLAAAQLKLVRATFPLGAVSGEAPSALRVTSLAAPQGERGWTLAPVWAAPADASVPGRSFFAVLGEGGAAEGDRLDAYAAVGEQRNGLEVPAAAVVMSEGKFWCYVERMPGTYVRLEIPVNEPTAHGYFVTSGLHAGDKVVTTAAGWLLAQESNTGEEPD